MSVPVKDYPDIESRIEEGTRNRTVAATNMNATSRLVRICAEYEKTVLIDCAIEKRWILRF